MKKLLTLVIAATVGCSSLVLAAESVTMAPVVSSPATMEKAPVKHHVMHKKTVKAPVQKAQAAKKKVKKEHKAAMPAKVDTGSSHQA